MHLVSGRSTTNLNAAFKMQFKTEQKRLFHILFLMSERSINKRPVFIFTLRCTAIGYLFDLGICRGHIISKCSKNIRYGKERSKAIVWMSRMKFFFQPSKNLCMISYYWFCSSLLKFFNAIRVENGIWWNFIHFLKQFQSILGTPLMRFAKDILFRRKFNFGNSPLWNSFYKYYLIQWHYSFTGLL